MKKVLSVVLSICMMFVVLGCTAEDQKQTVSYVFTEEAGMFTMTDTQTLYARGDKVYELLETTTLEFKEPDETTLEMLVAYYNDTVASMQSTAPEGVEVSSSYEGNVYTFVMTLHLEHADLKALVDGGYLMALTQENPEDFTYLSFKQACADLKASGYTQNK